MALHMHSLYASLDFHMDFENDTCMVSLMEYERGFANFFQLEQFCRKLRLKIFTQIQKYYCSLICKLF